MEQTAFDFQPGLTDQFPDFMDCVRESVYGCGRQFKAIAADLDMAPSKLSRMLNNDPTDRTSTDRVYFPLVMLPALMRATGDSRPVHWLVESFLEDAETKRNRAMDGLARMLPQIEAMVKAAAPPPG